jgi:CheY-like chemotaxis protein
MATPRALLADDDADFLDVVVRVTEHVGIQVVRATSGHDLLDKLANGGRFDVVVTDIAMPWMTGLHVMHSARGAGWTRPVIVMSGLHDGKTRDQVAALGPRVMFLLKPFSFRDLEVALRRALPRGTDTHTVRD